MPTKIADEVTLFDHRRKGDALAAGEDAARRFARVPEHNDGFLPGLHDCLFIHDEHEHALVQCAPNLLSQPHEIADADIFCLGGIEHTGKAIGALPAKLREIFPQEERYKILTYHPVPGMAERVREVYRWNEDKTSICPEMHGLAQQIWEAKFLRGRELVPPEQLHGFCLLTFSCGNRMSFMLENALREKLREQGCDSARIGEYFGRLRRVCIASSVDLHGMGAENLRPAIPTIQLIRQEDHGVAYWKDFHAACIATPLSGHYANFSPNDVREMFNEPVPHRVIVFAKGAPFPAHYGEEQGHRPDVKGHALSSYLALMQTLAHDDMREIHAFLSIADPRRAQHAPETEVAIGTSAPLPPWTGRG